MFNTKFIFEFLEKNKEQIGVVIAKFVYESYSKKELFDDDGKLIQFDHFDMDNSEKCVRFSSVLCKAYHTYDKTKELMRLNKSLMSLIAMYILHKNNEMKDFSIKKTKKMEELLKTAVIQDQEFFVDMLMVAFICCIKMIGRDFAIK